MPETASYRLADHLLGGTLKEYVTTRRERGLAWRRIAQQLWIETDGQVDVTYETLRNWFPDSPSPLPSDPSQVA